MARKLLDEKNKMTLQGWCLVGLLISNGQERRSLKEDVNSGYGEGQTLRTGSIAGTGNKL